MSKSQLRLRQKKKIFIEIPSEKIHKNPCDRGDPTNSDNNHEIPSEKIPKNPCDRCDPNSDNNHTLKNR